MKNLNQLYQEWQALQPLNSRKQYLLSRRFMVDYNYNSNHIEGNTLTYGQTELLLLFDKISGEGGLKDFNDMKASQISLMMMEEQANKKSVPLTQNFIRTLHKTLLREDYTVYKAMPDGQQTSYTIHAGRYKTRPNSVITRYGTRFDYASPEETPALMTDLVDWFNKEEETGKLSPVQVASIFHYRYIRIHPFEDGNGRIARLTVNYILLRHDWPMVVVRYRDKSQYIEALHQTDVEVGPVLSDGAHATLRQIGPFTKFFQKLFAAELKYNIDFATEKSTNIWWYDGQKMTFRSKTTPIILKALKENPTITIESLSQKAAITTSAVKKQLRQMQDKGYFEWRGNEGAWYVFASPSM